MNSLILNRNESFVLPSDGWYHLCATGEFPHGESGLVQVVDLASCDAMLNAFYKDAAEENFAGLLIDFDHFSLDNNMKSEAAGWITQLENRETGIWGKVRWSDSGEASVKGGRYRFISPVWSRGDCEDLGNNRVRPVRLLNAAVTNDPNLKGMVPLSNRSGGRLLSNAADRPQMMKWSLGSNDDHCPSCTGLAGQIHPQTVWDDANVRPGGGRLFCRDSCRCTLEPTTESERGNLAVVKLRENVMNRSPDKLENEWSDAARAASIAVRKAKAAARRAARDENESSQAPKKPTRSTLRAPGDVPDEGIYLGGSKNFDESTGTRQDSDVPIALPSNEIMPQDSDVPIALPSNEMPLKFNPDAGPDESQREKTDAYVEILEARVEAGEALNSSDAAFLKRYSLPANYMPTNSLKVANRSPDKLENEWSDAARAASIAVRKAKAAARSAARDENESSQAPKKPTRSTLRAPGDVPDEGIYLGGSKNFDESTGTRTNPDEPLTEAELSDDLDFYVDASIAAFKDKYGRDPASDADIAEAEELGNTPVEYRTGGDPISKEDQLASVLAAQGEYFSGDGDADFERIERESMAEVDREGVELETEAIRQKLSDGEALTSGEESLLLDLADQGALAGGDDDPVSDWLDLHWTDAAYREQLSLDEGSDEYLGDNDPEFQRAERDAMDKYERETQRANESRDAAVQSAHSRADGLIERQATGDSLSSSDSDWLARYHEIMGNRGGVLEDAGPADFCGAAAVSVGRSKADARCNAAAKSATA